MPTAQTFSRTSRRGILRRAAALAAFGPLFRTTKPASGAPLPQGSSVNRNSSPSDLKITDMRASRVASNYDYPIIKIYTNQDVYGLGEVRDAGVEGQALVMKPHLKGKNPLHIEPILDSIRHFTTQQRGGGGYSAIDMALHDIAGKVFGVPAYRLVGSQYRDKIRIYCDTDQSEDPQVFAERLRKRKEAGFTFFKMDLGTSLVAGRPGAVNSRGVATVKGLEMLTRVHRGGPRRHWLRSSARRRPLRPAQRQRLHRLRPGLRTLPARLGRGHAASRHAQPGRRRPEELARLPGDQGIDDYPNRDRRKPLRPGRRFSALHRQPCD